MTRENVERRTFNAERRMNRATTAADNFDVQRSTFGVQRLPEGPSLLHLASVETFIGGSRILRGVTLDVQAGEVVALMGRNGVGKSTTLRSITGVLPIRSGAVTFGGERIDRQPADQRARAGIAYVPQGRDIFPHLTVEENLHVGLVVHGRSGSAARTALERVFALFPVLEEMLGRKGGVLSGGQQQQLAIGRALLTNPRLLILDEPTEGIQPSIIEHIGDTLKSSKPKASRTTTPRNPARDPGAQGRGPARDPARRAIRGFLPRRRRSLLRDGSWRCRRLRSHRRPHRRCR